MVNVAPASTVTSPSTIYGLFAAVHVVSAGMLPLTYSVALTFSGIKIIPKPLTIIRPHSKIAIIFFIILTLFQILY